MLVIITGTPGVGKTTLAKAMVKNLGFTRIDLHDYYNELSIGYDKEKHCFDINVDDLIEFMKKQDLGSKVVIDSHIAHYLPKEMVNLCIALTCSDIKVLRERLEQRNYDKGKIQDNIDSELFEVCKQDALEFGHKVISFDTSDGMDEEKVLEHLQKELSL